MSVYKFLTSPLKTLGPTTILDVSWKDDVEFRLVRLTGGSFQDTFVLHVYRKSYHLSLRVARTIDNAKRVARLLEDAVPLSDVSCLPTVSPLQQWSINLVKTSCPEWYQTLVFLLDHLRLLTLSVTVEGCSSMFQLIRVVHVSKPPSPRAQTLYVLGEDHSKPGNITEVLHRLELEQDTPCRIDVILEVPPPSWEALAVMNDGGQPVFALPNPRSNVASSRQERNRSKVHFWREDYRFADLFLFLNFVMFAPEAYHPWVEDFYHHFCRASLLLSHPLVYRDQLIDILSRLRDVVEQDFPMVSFSWTTGALTALLNQMSHVDPTLLRQWLDMIQESVTTYKINMAPLFDLPACLRVLQLLRTGEPRRIFVLCGSQHAIRIRQMLLCIPKVYDMMMVPKCKKEQPLFYHGRQNASRLQKVSIKDT